MSAQLSLLAGPELRPDLRWYHERECACNRPNGSPRCGSCPFTTSWLGARRPSNKALGLSHITDEENRMTRVEATAQERKGGADV